jgi:hypothetical protein
MNLPPGYGYGGSAPAPGQTAAAGFLNSKSFDPSVYGPPAPDTAAAAIPVGIPATYYPAPALAALPAVVAPPPPPPPPAPPAAAAPEAAVAVAPASDATADVTHGAVHTAGTVHGGYGRLADDDV